MALEERPGRVRRTKEVMLAHSRLGRNSAFAVLCDGLLAGLERVPRQKNKLRDCEAASKMTSSCVDYFAVCSRTNYACNPSL